VQRVGGPLSSHADLAHAPPPPHGPRRSRPHPGGGHAWQWARRSRGSYPFAASPPPNRSRVRESREAEKRFAGKAVSRGRLAQLCAEQLPKLLAKLCQRHPSLCSACDA
jgi:hypothetical protein